MNKLLFDTDVIIDHLRGHKSATKYLLEKKSSLLLVSAITVAELYAGMRNQQELEAADRILTLFQVIAVDHELSIAGGHICKKYKNSHGTGLPDALIAATVLHHEATLITLNTRHFPMVKTKKPYEK